MPAGATNWTGWAALASRLVLSTSRRGMHIKEVLRHLTFCVRSPLMRATNPLNRGGTGIPSGSPPFLTRKGGVRGGLVHSFKSPSSQKGEEGLRVMRSTRKEASPVGKMPTSPQTRKIPHFVSKKHAYLRTKWYNL